MQSLPSGSTSDAANAAATVVADAASSQRLSSFCRCSTCHSAQPPHFGTGTPLAGVSPPGGAPAALGHVLQRPAPPLPVTPPTPQCQWRLQHSLSLLVQGKGSCSIRDDQRPARTLTEPHTSTPLPLPCLRLLVVAISAPLTAAGRLAQAAPGHKHGWAGCARALTGNRRGHPENFDNTCSYEARQRQNDEVSSRQKRRLARTSMLRLQGFTLDPGILVNAFPLPVLSQALSARITELTRARSRRYKC